MKLKKVKFSDVMIEFDYNMTTVAKKLGVTKQLVSTWKEKEHIPIERQCQLEILTHGKLKANRKLLNM